MLAYAQSEWMMDYIIRSHGFASINKMLRAFGKGLTQKQVFEKVLGVQEDQFDKEFHDWARKTIKQWGFDPNPPPNLKDTTKEVQKNPEDPAIQGRHALALLRARKYGEARKAAEKTLRLRPKDTTGLRVLGNVYLREKDYDQAIAVCKKLEAIDPTTTTAPQILARCRLAQKDWAGAIAALELLQKRAPLEAFAYKKLAGIYIQLGQSEKALPNLIYLHKHTMNDPKYARQIAEIFRALNRDEQALNYFREVTYINPYETSAMKAMAAIHLRLKQYDRAVSAATGMTLLEPKSAESWNYLAATCYRAGKAEKNIDRLHSAKNAAQKALKLDPKSHAGQILRHIDSAIEKLQNDAL
jgi:tetratricopeptide (TPR) repeat protein